MHTHNRSGVQIEQCSNCRGIFLDYGELEALSQFESHYAPPPPPGAPAPMWGNPGHYGHGHGHHKRRGFGKMLFSS
ncbi:zf-TFIIB domain-containing protein [Nocardia sp. CDC159]|uniref:Zf-TFIIB domain-containing protein n=2 Tax=Nocardiaceae TaxID=85025 RepID=A0A9X2ECY3_9NOCA|nr:zf-TFIIB domain-containing protein [Nocardia pulmonis]MCM6788061.1 zf-TFIIB domain-containing protein [Nocardia sp. CDC159]